MHSQSSQRIPICRRRCLVVDDMRGSRLLLTAALTKVGIDSVEAIDGMAAWKLFQRESFDVVISDYEMPRCTGLQLLHAMRHSLQADIKQTPIVIVSSAESKFVRDRVASFEASYFLPKPIDVAALIELLTLVTRTRSDRE